MPPKDFRTLKALSRSTAVILRSTPVDHGGTLRFTAARSAAVWGPDSIKALRLRNALVAVSSSAAIVVLVTNLFQCEPAVSSPEGAFWAKALSAWSSTSTALPVRHDRVDLDVVDLDPKRD